jgi:alginate O-acetyltransferase complex protein AlgI
VFFHSIQFLAFLGLTFAAYWAVHRHRLARLAVLLGASLLFYAAFTPFPILIFAWCALVDWGVARLMEKTTVQRTHKILLALSIVMNLGVLCVFKYADLFFKTSAWLCSKVGLQVEYRPLGLLLPIGLSFVVFKAISLSVDIYRGDLRGFHSYPEHLLYLLFFPQVISGPIVRASDLLTKFARTPRLTPEAGAQGMLRIAVGLTKKLLIADVLAAQIVDRVFENPALYTSAECVFAAVAYTFQLYCDFSGYSDISIGAASLFGFHVPENFNKPYLARNLFEFWNRWHMSLSTWLRDYLYIPLGGNRGSRPNQLFNLLVVMMLGGLWHGADWRFALWGSAHGLGLILTRCWWWARGGRPKEYGPLAATLGLLGTMSIVVLTRIIFRAPDMAKAGVMYLQMLELTWGLPNVSALAWAAMAAAIISHGVPQRTYELVEEWFQRFPIYARAAAFLALGMVIRQVATLEVRPYIYFQF